MLASSHEEEAAEISINGEENYGTHVDLEREERVDPDESLDVVVREFMMDQMHRMLPSERDEIGTDMVTPYPNIISEDYFGTGYEEPNPNEMSPPPLSPPRTKTQKHISIFGSFTKRMLHEFKHMKKKRVIKRSKTVYDKMNIRERKDLRLLLMDLGYAFSLYGSSAQSVEYHLTILAIYFGLKITVNSTPVGIWLNIDTFRVVKAIHEGDSDSDEDFDVRDHTFIKKKESKTYLKKRIQKKKKKKKEIVEFKGDVGTSNYFVKVGGVSALNLAKLCALQDTVEQVLRGKHNVHQAREIVENIVTQKPLYHYFLFQVFAAILMSVSGAFFFNGTGGEIIAAAVAGFLVSVWTVIVERVFFISSKNLLSLTSAILSGLIGIAFKRIFVYYDIFYVDALLVLFSGVYTLLPGFEFITAISELNMRNLLSGIIRLVSTCVSVAQLLFGAMISARLSKMINGEEDKNHPRADTLWWVNAIVVPIFAIASMIQMGITLYPVTAFFTIFVSYVALFFTNYMVSLLGLEIGTMMGALAVGIIATLFNKLFKRPSLLVSSVGILLLVPCVVSEDSVQALMKADVGAGINSLMQSGLTAFALAVGLMFSDIVSMLFTDKGSLF
jgi:uncharacterized membrane protein YjjP (DUF1212 family)